MKKGMIVKKKMGEKFCFDLLAADGLVLCRSVDYATEEACMEAIESLRKNCGAPIEDDTVEGFVAKPCPKYEMRRNEIGEFRFLLKNETGNILVHGPAFLVGYTCKRGIEQVEKYAPDASIVVPNHTGDISTGQVLHV